MNNLTIGSLFDGSGGFPLAAFNHGIVPVWSSEVEPYPIAVTKERFPYVKQLGDVTKVNGAEIDPVDVISFGSPCTDVSVAGKRVGIVHLEHGGEETTRSGLFYEAVRIVKEMREKTNGQYPRYIVFENVPGILSCHNGEDFRTVLEEITGICGKFSIPGPENGKWGKAGTILGDTFSVAWRILDAKYFGVAQRRKRLFLVGCLSSRCAGRILFECESQPRNFQAFCGQREGASQDHGRSAGGNNRLGTGRKDQEAQADFLVYDARGNGDGRTVPTITGDHENRVTDYTAICIGNGQLHQTDLGDKTGALNCMHDQQIVVTSAKKTSGRKYIVRRLMPIECCRLQGFPDGWADIGIKTDMTPDEVEFFESVRETYQKFKGKPYTRKKDVQSLCKWYNKLHSASAEYKMWGNGVALPCVELIMKGIVLEEERNSQ